MKNFACDRGLSYLWYSTPAYSQIIVPSLSNDMYGNIMDKSQRGLPEQISGHAPFLLQTG